MNRYSEDKLELMRTIKQQIKTLKSNLVLLQSGNGGEIPRSMDYAAMDLRVSISNLDNKLEKILWLYSKNNR